MTMLQNSGVPQPAPATGPEAAREARLPLTEDQLGLLLRHRADPAASPYNVPLAVDLRGPFDSDALQTALARLVARHPLLSARVTDPADDTNGDGRPYLRLGPTRVPRLERRTAALRDRDGEFPARALIADARQELDLERDGALRAVLIGHGPDHHTLLLVVHQLVVDGESTALLLADLLAAYEYGDVPGPAPADYGDYVAARAREADKDPAAAEAYWCERLDGADLTVDFPLDVPAAESAAPREAAVPLALDAELWSEVTAFSRAHRAGAAAVLLAAYLKALGSYGRQSAPTVGVPLGTRTDPRFDRTVGHFVRTLLVRAPGQEDRTAAEYVTAVQTELARAVDNSRLPYQRIARLAPGTANRIPFNCAFLLHSWDDTAATATEGVMLRGGLRAHWRRDVPTPGLGLLTLELYEGQGTLHGYLKYDAARIEPATAEAFTEHVTTLAGQLVRHPKAPVTELDGLGPHARTTLDHLNATDHPHPDTDIDTLLRERVVAQGLEGDSTAAPAARAHRPGNRSPLAPVQRWFFRHIKTDPQQWNQSVLLELNRPVDPALLRLALQAVVRAHPALSARFEGEGDPEARAMVDAVPFAAYAPRDVLWERDTAGHAELDQVMEEVERSLDPLAGVNVRALLAHDRRTDAAAQRPAAAVHLLIAVHHLVVDGVSWRILLEDLEHALGSLADGALPALPDEACRYRDWVAALPATAARPGEADYWRRLAAARTEAQTLLLTEPAPDEQHIRRVEFSLDPNATARLIGPLPRRLGLQVHQVMTGAFAQALARWRGSRAVTFDVATHGRHGRDDLYRTVGWFTSIHPVVLAADRAAHPEQYLAQIGADLTGVPEGGVGFGACREFAADRELRTLLRELPPALVCFNYYGKADQLSPGGGFTLSGRPVPREHSARCERVYGIEAYGIVHGGRLRMGLTWVPSPADGVHEAGVEALVEQMGWVLATLAGADPATVAPAEIATPGSGTSARSPAVPVPGAAALPGMSALLPDGGTNASDGTASADGTDSAGGTDSADGAADSLVTVPVTPQQHGLLLDALAHRGTGRYVEQRFWRWHGPLDIRRFIAAWQSVFDRETVLRAAFDWDEEPCLVLHEHVAAEVVRHSAGTVDWDELRERDRLRGFDLHRPGLLRIAVVDDPATPESYGPDMYTSQSSGAEAKASARILLTFHHVLLDGWSVSILLQEFYRAYLADGALPGGERRPDIRDYATWLADQDTGPAREFWSGAVPSVAPAVRPAVPGPATGERGPGRAEVRLGPAEADRLRAWAAARAATESSALQAVWALLLYRASGAAGPAPVGFGVTVSGRGIGLDAVERLPGLLMNSLPMTLQVDPEAPLTALLTQLRDQALDMAAYEWVSTGQIHEWSGRRAGEKLVESLIVFENYPRTSDGLEGALAARGIRVEPPGSAGAQTAFPVTLLAYRDVDGDLVLAAVHDRERLSDTDATQLVSACARLLRTLSGDASGLSDGGADATTTTTTVADVLDTITDADLPRMADPPAPPTGPSGPPNGPRNGPPNEVDPLPCQASDFSEGTTTP
ncbi:condensation domain-containing protein [Streptomyces sp. NPDC002851]